jgi:hypothetical protein
MELISARTLVTWNYEDKTPEFDENGDGIKPNSVDLSDNEPMRNLNTPGNEFIEYNTWYWLHWRWSGTWGKVSSIPLKFHTVAKR